MMHVTQKTFTLLLITGAVTVLIYQREVVYQVVSFIKPPTTKYVLYWTPFWNQKDYFIGFGHEPFKNCQYRNCYATDNKTLIPLEKFDMLIFHAIHLNGKLKIPEIRSPHQRYVLMNIEAPIHICPNLKPWNSFFNWTMTYRFDSDIVRRHGYMLERQDEYQMPSEEVFRNKTKLAAWFVSNCDTASKREVLAKELQKYMQLDVYGQCGKFKCARRGKLSKPECYDMVERDYKFYFSFENSFCKDYSTEKLYYVLQRNVVPVVYGFGDYNLSAPPNSVINVADFDSAEHFATYLKEVAADYKTYNKFFEWKKKRRISTDALGTACQICQKLNEPLTTSIYHDMVEWWWGKDKSHCRTHKSLPEIVSDHL